MSCEMNQWHGFRLPREAQHLGGKWLR